MSGRNKQGRDFAKLVLGGVRTAQGRNLGVSAHNAMDLERDTERLSQSRGGIATETHQPIPHHRLQGHMDAEIAQMGRGGDSRTRVSNNVSVVRRMRDNDPINIDRPLG
jgi:hypothetical protein